MTSRPIHRWKSLWLGLVVLILLAGAWRRSIHRYDVAGHDFSASGYPSIIIGQGAGKVAIAWITYPHSSHFYVVVPSIYLGQSPLGLPSSFHYRGLGDIRLTFAHWFIILIFTLCWLTFLASRRERMRTLGEALTAAEDDAKANAKPNASSHPTHPPDQTPPP